ncbi:MAG: hypothetical protein ACAI34_17845 [Verrucomicrobium sp.]
MDHVIDINYLRTPADPTVLKRPELGALLQSSAPGDRFILADTALIETMKNRQWESTSRNSFKIVSQYPEKIWIATEISKLMNAELNSGRDTDAVLDLGLTEGFRDLLREIASGNDGPAMNTVRNNILQAQKTLATQQQNHPQNLGSLKAAFDGVRKDVKVKEYRRLTDIEQRQIRLRYAKTQAQISTRNVAKEEDKSQEVGDALATGRGAMIRLQIGYTLLGFKWAVNNGLDSFPDTKATNEIMDLDHAVIATYFDGILTEEASVEDMRQDILDALDVEPLQLPTPPAAP